MASKGIAGPTRKLKIWSKSQPPQNDKNKGGNPRLAKMAHFKYRLLGENRENAILAKNRDFGPPAQKGFPGGLPGVPRAPLDNKGKGDPPGFL